MQALSAGVLKGYSDFYRFRFDLKQLLMNVRIKIFLFNPH